MHAREFIYTVACAVAVVAGVKAAFSFASLGLSAAAPALFEQHDLSFTEMQMHTKAAHAAITAMKPEVRTKFSRVGEDADELVGARVGTLLVGAAVVVVGASVGDVPC